MTHDNLDKFDKDFFTILFVGDIGKFSSNPLQVETPFGLPEIVARGDVFEERDRLELERDELKADALRLHHEKMDFFDRAIAAEVRCKTLMLALEKISGAREYDPEDHRRAATYKREEGVWTTDEYLADAALAASGCLGRMG